MSLSSVPRPKASDIDDAAMLTAVYTEQYATHQPNGYPYGIRGPHTVGRWSIEDLMPQYPGKVVLAKLRALTKRGLLSGCYCGCRGDFEITDAGLVFIAPVEPS